MLFFYFKTPVRMLFDCAILCELVQTNFAFDSITCFALLFLKA